MQLTPLQKPTKTGSSLGIFIACLVLSLALLFFLLLPKYSAYKAAKDTAATDKQNLENLKVEQAKVTALFEQIKKKDDDLKRVDLAIPDKAGVPELYAYVETLAKGVNLKISSLQAKDEAEALSSANKLIGVTDTAGITGAGAAPGASGTKNTSLSPTLGVVDIDLQLTGSLNDYITFLGSVQNSLRIIDVQSINIGASDSGDGGSGTGTDTNTSLKFITSLKTYYQKQK